MQSPQKDSMARPIPILFIDLWCRALAICIPSFLVRAELTFTILNS